ncbi:transmembrane protein [Tieghemostelium lacteum]|uniref:Transmembrane protein n=1 Tax=Tieghemostelium lacteum TaxID=361077 RepID=A0A151Z2J5_TIELA|nr:transmembrane protein [Tieghemostelium lacteum]|eukprot:KYQ88186.1 transmembrane protein [Tieghemostelium lacteum]
MIENNRQYYNNNNNMSEPKKPQINNTEYQEIFKEVQELQNKQKELEENGLKFREQYNEGYRELGGIISSLDKNEKSTKALSSRLSSLIKSDKSIASMEETKELSKQLQQINLKIKDSKSKFIPETGSIFVRLFLGQVNVKHYRESEKFRLKQEYEKFKMKTNPQFLLFVVLLYLYPDRSFVTTSWQIWLLYYYVTLALRENILLVNGSKIRNWWIMHHYISIVGSLTNLLWPTGGSFSYFLPQITYFSGCQGIVQMLSSRYQQGQLYKQVAMGKASVIDVTGESDGWTPSALFLLPFLLFVQLFQLYNSFCFFAYSYRNNFDLHDWQVISSGLIFLLLGSGNLYTTITTYYYKYFKSPQQQQQQQNVQKID